MALHLRCTALATALACVTALAACSSSPATTPGGTDAIPTSTAPAPTSPAPTTTGTTPPPGPTLTTVRVHYASTSAPSPAVLTIRGSAGPLSWDTGLPLTAAGANVYTWSAPDLTGSLELKPLLGETWSRGPNYTLTAGQSIDIYPRFTVAQGQYDRHYPSFTSAKLPSTRGLWVYLPPTYLENTESRFGVLYMHDGANLFDPSTAFGGNEWKVDETLNAGAEDGSIREVIVVGIESTAARIDELTPVPDPTYGGGKGDQYLSMTIDEIKPLVDKDFRTSTGREDTAIMGSSLGGLMSAYAGVVHADVFSLVGEMSPSTWWDGTVILGDVDTTKTRPMKPTRVYVDSGDAGASQDDVTNTTELAARYRAAGYVDDKTLLHVVQSGGQHNEVYWAQRLPAALHFLLGPRPY